jgi:hypothetical protein
VVEDNYSANSKLPSITSIPNAVPTIVGQLVPTTGRVGVVVAVAVGLGHRQSVSDKHCVFLQLPEVEPLGM